MKIAYYGTWQRLYNLGGRKFIIPGIGTMGCIPNMLARTSDGRCSEEVNQLSRDFNANLRTMIANLNANLPGSRFTYLDIDRMNQDILANPTAYGIAFPSLFYSYFPPCFTLLLFINSWNAQLLLCFKLHLIANLI